MLPRGRGRGGARILATSAIYSPLPTPTGSAAPAAPVNNAITTPAPVAPPPPPPPAPWRDISYLPPFNHIHSSPALYLKTHDAKIRQHIQTFPPIDPTLPKPVPLVHHAQEYRTIIPKDKMERAQRTGWLDLAWCVPEQFPGVWSKIDFSKLTDLKGLDLEGTGIKTVPPEVMTLTSLTYLNLSQCPLVSLPENLGQLSMLQTLGLGVLYLQKLPYSFTNLKNLQILNITLPSYEHSWKALCFSRDALLQGGRFVVALFELITPKPLPLVQKKLKLSTTTTASDDQEPESAWVWGRSQDHYQHAMSPLSMSQSGMLPKQILMNEQVVGISCGDEHTVWLTDTGRIYTSGGNTYGQLGNGEFVDCRVSVPVQHLLGKFITKVSCGYHFTCALSDTGTVYMWGKLSTEKQPTMLLSVPAEVEPLKQLKIVDIAAGGAHVLAITNQGAVYSWGSNDYGQLGRVCTLSEQHKSPAWPNLIPPNSLTHFGEYPIVKIAAGQQHSIALDSNNNLFCWGRNNERQASHDNLEAIWEPTKLQPECGPIQDIAASGFSTVVLTTTGKVFLWGKFTRDRKLTPPSWTPVKPVVEITGFGDDNVAMIGCGYNHYIALTDSGKVYTWGYSVHGQCGQGIPNYFPKPVQVPGLNNISYVAAGGDISAAAAGLKRNILGEDLRAFINTPTFSDVTIRLTTGKQYLAHKCILAARSPVLAALLSSQLSSSSPVVDLPISDEVAFGNVLQYAYTDRFPFCKQEVRERIFSLANSLQIPRLAAITNPEKPEYPPSVFGKELHQLLSPKMDPSYADISLNLQDNVLRVHKLFLVARSPYFKAMLSGGMAESQSGTIDFAHVASQVMELVLQYIYTDELPDDVDVNTAVDIIPLANEYQMDRLKQKCEKIVETGVDSESVVYVYQMATMYQAEKLKRFCITLIIDNPKEVLRSEYYQSLSPEEQLPIMELIPENK